MDFLASADIWLTVSFILFVILAFKALKNPFLGMIDARIVEIQKELETSENLRIEAQELLAQYQRKHKDALQEAKDVVAQAEKHAAQIRKDAETELSENIAMREKQLKERLKRMEKSAINEIRNYASDIAVDVTRQIIESNLDKKSDAKLIDQSISQVSKHLH